MSGDAELQALPGPARQVWREVDGLRLYLAQQADLQALAALAQDSDWLQEEEKAALARIKSAARRTEYLCGHAWLRWLLARELACQPEQVRLAFSAQHKPYALPGPAGQAAPAWNLSHAHGHFALVLGPPAAPAGTAAFKPCGGLGVDIEFPQQVSAAELRQLAQGFCHAQELAHLHALPDSAVSQAFLRLWCGKEAVAKALGCGFLFSPKRIVLQAESFVDGAVQTVQLEGMQRQVALWQWRVEGDGVLGVARVLG
ncbi:4'-phosphopantetheinyl transferase superfamily protein [Massilia sp. W12]|uniref:4'-phosphopantetheinyl transferase family protein n=1 Tax=Massilia sp. W12 TaxID=3126507 RepID=UPI0030D4A787